MSFDAWPPPGHLLTLHPHEDGSLRPELPARPAEMTYKYDPAQPTPMAGGRSLNLWTAGRRDQKVREERDDVLVWTSGPLTRDTLIAGEVEVTVAMASTNPTVDLFVRLCEVDRRGRSWNLADGYLRAADDGTERGRLGPTRTHVVTLGATAAHVARGHRLRLAGLERRAPAPPAQPRHRRPRARLQQARRERAAGGARARVRRRSSSRSRTSRRPDGPGATGSRRGAAYDSSWRAMTMRWTWLVPS